MPLNDDIKCFESNWNPNLNHGYIAYTGHHEIDERQCGDTCACQKLQDRARNDPYIFSLAPNPFYLWLICTVSNIKLFLFESVNLSKKMMMKMYMRQFSIYIFVTDIH